MFEPIAWDAEFVMQDGGDVATESLITMGPDKNASPTGNSKPINITSDDGIFYATVYACHCQDNSVGQQQISIWLASLKDTDQVRLTVMSVCGDIDLMNTLALLTSLVSTKAKLSIYLDSIVCDNLAYFYLIPEKIIVGSEGALYIPSYSLTRSTDHSGSVKAILDFFKWITEEAAAKGILTQEEAMLLQDGTHVVIPTDRFNV